MAASAGGSRQVGGYMHDADVTGAESVERADRGDRGIGGDGIAVSEWQILSVR